MKTREDILDEFGRLVVAEVYDRQMQFLQNDLKLLSNSDDYAGLFSQMNLRQKKILDKYVHDMLEAVIFDFLKIYEENRQYQILYKSESQTMNLVEISEMLKSEPLGEEGWLKRFSKYSSEDNQ